MGKKRSHCRALVVQELAKEIKQPQIQQRSIGIKAAPPCLAMALFYIQLSFQLFLDACLHSRKLNQPVTICCLIPHDSKQQP